MYILLMLIVLVVLSTIASGIILGHNGKSGSVKKGRIFIKYSMAVFVPLLAAALMLSIPQAAHAADGESSNSGLALIGAAISTGLAALGAGIAVASVGSSALGAVTEDPKMLGRTLIFVGLAEGIAIYGLVISIIILGRV